MAVTGKRQYKPSPHQARTAKVVGLLFLAAIFAYATGNGLVESVLHAPDSLTRVTTHRLQLGAGALLMLLNSAIVVAIGVVMMPVLKPYNEVVAYGYLSSRVVEAVMLAVGVVCLLSVTALGGAAQEQAGAPHLQALSALALKSQFFAYQIAMAALGLGSIFFCHLLHQSQLIPRPLAAWGWVGYAVFLAGALLEIMSVYDGVGLMLSIPGGLFEVVFGVWLLVKGFGTPAETHDAQE